MRALNAFLYDIYHRQEIIRAGRIPADLVLGNAAYLPGDDRPQSAAQRLQPHHRRRHRAGQRERVLRAGGQSPHAVRRLLHAGEPGDDDASLPGAFRQPPRGADRADIRRCCCGRCRRSRRPPATAIRRSRCSRRASTIPPSSSIPSSPTRWASSWSRGRTSSSRTATSTCARRSGRERLDVIYRRIDDDFLDPLTFHSGLHARRARADGPLSRRPRDDRQRAGRRHRRRQGGLHLRAGDHPVLHRAAADPAERADLALLDPGRAVAMCWRICRNWW